MKAWKLGYSGSLQKAKATYQNIGNIPCPAFGGEYVAFTSVGFNHLVRKGRKARSKNEQKKRFVLVQYVEVILKQNAVTIEYRQSIEKRSVNRRGEKVLIESLAEFWTFREKIGDCTVKVVVRQLTPGDGKHFFSVMGDNVAIQKSNQGIKKSRV